LGLAVEEHLSLHGIAKTSRKGKSIIKKYEEQEKLSEPLPEPPLEDNVDDENSESSDKQFTLDSF